MKIAYDVSRMMIGCVNVQAGLGGDSRVCHLFETRYWLTHPTNEMKVYETTPEQLEVLIRKTEEAHAETVMNP